MERKKALALVGMLMILLASFALVGPIPPASAAIVENRRYCVMPIDRKIPGNIVVRDSLNEAPIEQGIWNFTVPPLSSYLNITFSNKWEKPGYGWIVNLTVPATSYVGISYMFYDLSINFWFRLSTSMSTNGYGWIFLNGSYGDVDCHTVCNNTAAYWRSPSPKAGQLAAPKGQLPSPGSDGVAGTADDGFGDNKTDPAGSSILILPTTMTAYSHNGTDWAPLFTFTWPQIFTTGNASTTVNQPGWYKGQPPGGGSAVHGSNLTEKGQPWEFYAGLDNPQYKVGYGHPKWNAYVTYVCAWSLLDIPTLMGAYDGCFAITERMVRTDCVIGDVDGNELVDSMDILVAALAFGSTGMNFGPDGIPYSPKAVNPIYGDDKILQDPNFDSRGDLSDDRWLIDSMDILVMGLDFGSELRPTCIWRPF